MSPVTGHSSPVMREKLNTQAALPDFGEAWPTRPVSPGSAAPLSHLMSNVSRFTPYSSLLTSPVSRLMPTPSPLTIHASRLTPHSLQSSRGFTMLEMLIVIFLLGGVMVLVIPRITISEDLSSTGRKFISTFRMLQRLAETGQKPVKLYLDLDQGTYWAMVVDGQEERRPRDAAWLRPRSFPDMIRMTEVAVGNTRLTYGRADLLFHPNGRIDPAALYFSDQSNNLLVLVVDSVTGNIRTLDQRPEFINPRPIPDRVRTLLQAVAQK